MKIYKISQNVNTNYDTYDSFVVCAKSKAKAKVIHELSETSYDSWVANVDDIKIEYLGEARKDLAEGEILGSFNAG